MGPFSLISKAIPDVPTGDEDPRRIIPAEELPVYGAPPPDRKWLIDSIVSALDVGQFQSSALVGDAIMRDPRIVGAMEQRNSGLFGAPLSLEAADDSDLAKRARDDVEDNWDRMFPRAEMEEWNQYGILQGLGIAEKIWDTSGKLWTFRIQPFHPQFYTWRWDLGCYTLLTRDGGLLAIPPKSTQWMTYAPYGYKRAFLRGRIRSLLDAWMGRQWNKNDWCNYNEKYGKPIVKAIVPQQASAAEARDFVNKIANMGNDTTIKTKQDKDGNKFDVELLESTSTGWKTFEALMQFEDKEISQVLLGQSMSTDGMAGLGAQEKPGEGVASHIRKSDNQKLCEAIRNQALRDFCEFNYGNPDLAPKPNYEVEPPEDEGQIALKNMNQASADVSYINSGVLTPEEVALSRFGSGEYSLNTEIDSDSRQAILETSMEELKVQAEQDLETAKNPPDPVQPGMPVKKKGPPK